MTCPICDGGGDAYLCEDEDCGFVGFCWHCVPGDGRCPDCGGKLVDESLVYQPPLFTDPKRVAAMCRTIDRIMWEIDE